MKKSLSRAVAITATCAAGLAGTLTYAPTAGAEAPAAAKAQAKAGNLTDFGFRADVYGTKVLVNGIELRTVKDAYAKQTCTRVVGRQSVKPSIASIPLDNDLIDLSASSSRTETYRRGSITGVKGVNTIASIALGGELPGGIETPTINIDGLVSTADSFFDAKAAGGKGAFGHDESFTFQGISIGNIDDSVVDEVPGLAELLYIVNDLVAPVNVIVDELVQLLSSVVGGTIEIPGLGSISLGDITGKATARHATSSASALRILVNPSGEKGQDTVLELGRARTYMAKGATSGVFGTQMAGMEFLSGNDALRMGGVGQISMPCEGTGGRVLTKRIPSVSLGLEPLASVLKLTGVEYRTMGKQQKKGKLRGFVESNLGKLEIPVAGITLEGLKSRIDVTRRPGKKTVRKVTGSVARLTVGDRTYTAKDLRMGKEIVFDGGVISIGKRIKTNWNGANVRMVDINLVDFGSIVTLGIADLYARPK